MLIYIIYFFLLMVLAVEYELKPFKNDLLLVLTILLLGLLAGLRGENVSKDYGNYQIIFDSIYDLFRRNDGIFLPIIEPVFAGIILVLRFFFQDNYGLAIMLFFSFTSVLLKVISSKKLSFNPFFVILFYFSHYFILHEMAQIRIGLACGLFFIGLIYYFKDYKRIYIALILIASLIHYSAILYLLIFVFDLKRFNKPIYIAILVTAIILGYLKIPLLDYFGTFNVANVSGRLYNYSQIVESGYAEGINVFNVLNLISIAVCLFFIFLIPREDLIDNQPLLLFLKCNILSIFLLSFFSGVPSVAFRFSELYGISSIFLFPQLVRYLPFHKFNLLITVIIAALIFYITAFHGDLLNPYHIIQIN